MNWLRRCLVLGFAAFGFGQKRSEAGIMEDVASSANSVAKSLQALGYKTDFSFESIKELERFMIDNVNDEGGAKPKSELGKDTGGRLFMLGSYLGEVIRREINGSWRGSDDDPEVILNVEVIGPNGAVIWPIQRIMKRFQNGSEDDVWAYAQGTIED